jgi:arylformamidase
MYAIILLFMLGACGQKTSTPTTSGVDSSASVHDTDPDPEPPAITAWHDLAYTNPSQPGSPTHRIDLYQRAGTDPQPLVVLVHGGSWVGGDKANFADAAPHFIPWWIAHGYTVAAVNFRLASPVGQPLTVSPKDQAADIAHALAWLHDHDQEYGIRPEDTVLVGYSSGAHLVALLGADHAYVEAAGVPHERIAATISLDVHAYDVPYALSLMVGSDVERNIPLIKHLFGSTEEAQMSASPIAYTDTGVAPAMLVSVGPNPDRPGTHGYIVDQTATHYAAALQAEGHQAVHFHDPSESHSSLAVGFGEADDAVTQQVEAFLSGR